MYRTALKLLDSWAIDRQVFLTEATALRTQFDVGAKCEPEDTKALMEAAYKKIEDYVHVDRYIRPYMPSGSQFMRNTPPPLETCYPHGVPQSVLDEFKEVGIYRDVDMSFPEEGKMSSAGQVLVDLATKRVY